MSGVGRVSSDLTCLLGGGIGLACVRTSRVVPPYASGRRPCGITRQLPYLCTQQVVAAWQRLKQPGASRVAQGSKVHIADVAAVGRRRQQRFAGRAGAAHRLRRAGREAPVSRCSKCDPVQRQASGPAAQLQWLMQASPVPFHGMCGRRTCSVRRRPGRVAPGGAQGGSRTTQRCSGLVGGQFLPRQRSLPAVAFR